MIWLKIIKEKSTFTIGIIILLLLLVLLTCINTKSCVKNYAELVNEKEIYRTIHVTFNDEETAYRVLNEIRPNIVNSNYVDDEYLIIFNETSLVKDFENKYEEDYTSITANVNDANNSYDHIIEITSFILCLIITIMFILFFIFSIQIQNNIRKDIALLKLLGLRNKIIYKKVIIYFTLFYLLIFILSYFIIYMIFSLSIIKINDIVFSFQINIEQSVIYLLLYLFMMFLSFIFMIYQIKRITPIKLFKN